MTDKEKVIYILEGRNDVKHPAFTGFEVHDIVKYAKANLIDWHKYPQDKPTKNERYLLTCEYSHCVGVTYGKWWDDEFCDIDEEGKVIAWAELPKPYDG